MKKAIALALAAAMSAGLLAGCGGGSTSTASSTTGEADSTASEAATPAVPEGDHTVNTTDPITLTISWWGGDSRHAAYQEAIAAFMEKYPNITVETSYGAWTGWEEAKSTELSSGNGQDVMQTNWNWLSQYSGQGQTFVDLYQYSDVIDLTQFPETALAACVVADELQGIPVAMTGRTFFWNMNTFKEAGIETPPSTLEELLAAGNTFKEVLGDEYYPVALGAYDRMIVMTFYLESVYGKQWVENGELQYTVDEVAEGLEFIQSLEDNHVTPSVPTMDAAAFDSIDKSQQWIDGQYAGIWEWDSSATKYHDALADNSGYTVGEEIKYGDAANGGFAKVSMCLSITETCEHPVEAAALINFLLNEEEGASIMGTQCGMVTSASGQAAAAAAGAVDPLVQQANNIVMDFVDFQLDPTYESDTLKGTGGYYEDAFEGLSYGDYSIEEAAEILVEGVNIALG